jgi:hypothetical protein
MKLRAERANEVPPDGGNEVPAAPAMKTRAGCANEVPPCGRQ